MDILIEDKGNGGDFKLTANDLQLTRGWHNMPYLAGFGGNPGNPTKPREFNEQAFDWWGNVLFDEQDTSRQMNSLLEHGLNNQVLNSNGRARLEELYTQDLAFMSEFADVEVTATITDIDRIEFTVQVIQPGKVEGIVPDQYRAFVLVFDAQRKELFGDFVFEDFNDDFNV